MRPQIVGTKSTPCTPSPHTPHTPHTPLIPPNPRIMRLTCSLRSLETCTCARVNTIGRPFWEGPLPKYWLCVYNMPTVNTISRPRLHVTDRVYRPFTAFSCAQATPPPPTPPQLPLVPPPLPRSVSPPIPPPRAIYGPQPLWERHILLHLPTWPSCGATFGMRRAHLRHDLVFVHRGPRDRGLCHRAMSRPVKIPSQGSVPTLARASWGLHCNDGRSVQAAVGVHI